MEKDNKEVILHNGRLSYQLIINGKHISFMEFFEKYHKKCGFKVKRTGDGTKDWYEK